MGGRGEDKRIRFAGGDIKVQEKRGNGPRGERKRFGRRRRTGKHGRSMVGA